MDPRYSASPYAANLATSRSSYPPPAPARSPPHRYRHHRPSDTRESSPSHAPHHQRRPSDSSYPPALATRLYPDQPPSAHSRALSLTSTRDRDFGRAMPPPKSPPQPGPQSSHRSRSSQQQHPPPHDMPGYGSGPPPPRPPPLSVGPPSSFPGGRELAALGPLGRSAPGGGSMSISSILGGPPSVSRDPQPPQHQFPPHSAATPGSGPGFAASIHGSPRMPSASTEFSPFRRPQTPDHQRPYDPRSSAAPSPRGPYGTPEVQRYGTPHSYHARHMSASADPSRDPSRMSVAAAPPPRPSSQPKAFPGMPPRPMESRAPMPEDRFGRRDDMGRAVSGLDYHPDRTGLRPYTYDDRYRAERERQNEIEQREQERREYERRERAYSGSDPNRPPPQVHELGLRDPPRNQPPPYGRPPEAQDPRDSHWRRVGSDASFRAPMDQQRHHTEYLPPSSASYPHGPPYQRSPERYPTGSQPPQSQSHPPAPPPQPYESPERTRLDVLHPQQQQQAHHGPPPQIGLRDRPAEEGPGGSAGPPSISFNAGQGAPSYDTPRHRNSDDASASLGHQRNLLAVQQDNRKGRISPLPQAVQGAQPQQPGPAAEPGIKSEFGRMFSGIGSGVGAMGASSPITSAPSGPFTNASLAKRDDAEGPDSGTDGASKGGKGRRRKLKEEDSRDDDSSGRATPGHKAKRPKAHQHHHHHHHHHHRLQEDGSQVPFRNPKGTTPVASPTERTMPPHHHHHHHHHGPRNSPTAQAQAAKAASPVPQIPPRTKTTVSSQAVLDAAAKCKRQHLGDFIYEPFLKPQRLLPATPLHRGFSSNPKPLPWDVIKDKVNCILTVKVPRIHLSPLAREEITARGYLWGTDVYTDDSDVVAACIHGGWIRGEWNDDVDVSMLDLDHSGEKRRRNKGKDNVNSADLQSEQLITSPPAAGPMPIPTNRDLHVNVLVLPKLSRYGATTRFGISSREFGGEYGARHVSHDGLSFMIHGIRWVENGAQPQSRLRGKDRRERMRRAMKEVRSTVSNLGGPGEGADSECQGRSQGGDVSGNWWRKGGGRGGSGQPEKMGSRRASDGDKENRMGDKADASRSSDGEAAQPGDASVDEAARGGRAVEAEKQQ